MLTEIKGNRSRGLVTKEQKGFDLDFPGELRVLSRAFELTKDNSGLKYPTLADVTNSAYRLQYRYSEFDFKALEQAVTGSLIEDLAGISSKLRRAEGIAWSNKPERLRGFFSYVQRTPLFRGLDVETLIQILHREPEGLQVIEERVRKQAQAPLEGIITEQRGGEQGRETHLILIPENDSEVIPASNTKLKPYEVFVAATMLLGLDPDSGLYKALRIDDKTLRFLESAVKETQSSKGRLFEDPTLCKQLYVKLLAIARDNLNAVNANLQLNAAITVVDIFAGVSDEEIKQLLSPGFTLVKKAAKA